MFTARFRDYYSHYIQNKINLEEYYLKLLEKRAYYGRLELMILAESFKTNILICDNTNLDIVRLVKTSSNFEKMPCLFVAYDSVGKHYDGVSTILPEDYDSNSIVEARKNAVKIP